MTHNIYTKTIFSLIITAALLTGCGKEKDQPAQDVNSLIDRASAYEKNGQYRLMCTTPRGRLNITWDLTSTPIYTYEA